MTSAATVHAVDALSRRSFLVGYHDCTPIEHNPRGTVCRVALPLTRGEIKVSRKRQFEGVSHGKAVENSEVSIVMSYLHLSKD